MFAQQAWTSKCLLQTQGQPSLILIGPLFYKLHSNLNILVSKPNMIKHSLGTTTFTQPTFCDTCHKFLWGLVKQGRSCSECKISLHEGCEPNIPCDKHVAQPLKLTSMTKNTYQYATRVGFMRNFELNVLNLFMWTDPNVTIKYFLIFSLVCLYPLLFFLMPSLIFIYGIVMAHPSITKQPPPEKYDIPTKISAQEYKLNLQYIQNLQGSLSEKVDASNIAYYEKRIWRNANTTKAELTKYIISLPIIVIIYYTIPVNIVWLLLGWFKFYEHSPLRSALLPWFESISKTAKAKAIETVKSRADSVSSLESLTNIDLKQSEDTAPFVIYENQRKFDKEYRHTSSDVSDDFPPFSNKKGSVMFPNPEEYQAPTGFEFKSEWCVTEWMLCDDKFNKIDATLHSTRRRKWVRMICLKKIYDEDEE